MGDERLGVVVYFLYLTGDHCWINLLKSTSSEYLTSYLFHCGLGFLWWDSGSSFSSLNWHTSLIYEKEILKQWQYFFFLLNSFTDSCFMYFFFFFFFFNDMSSLGNVPHPCRFLLSVFVWEQTAVTLTRVPFDVRRHHFKPCDASDRSICSIKIWMLSCITWSLLYVTFVDLPNLKILLLFFSCSFFSFSSLLRKTSFPSTSLYVYLF